MRAILLLGFALFCANAASVKAATWDEHVETIAISPDGVVKIWDIASGEAQHTLTDHESYVFSLSFHPDGQLLASADGDGVVKIWDVASGEAKHTLTGHGEYAEATFSPDGQLLVSGDFDGLVKVWDTQSFAEKTSFNNGASVQSLAISDDSRSHRLIRPQREFKTDLNAYLTGRGPDVRVKTLAELIAYNEVHADEIMPYFGQERLIKAQEKGPLTDQAYLDALAQNHFGGGCSSTAAVAGYPHITVPAGFIHDLPVGISFFAGAWQEPTLIKFAYAFEQGTQIWRAPKYLAKVGIEG